MTEKELNQELKDLRNPSIILCNFCNRLVEKFDSRLMFTDPEEVIKEAYAEEKEQLIKRMKAAVDALTERLDVSEDLLAEANKLINPDEK